MGARVVGELVLRRIAAAIPIMLLVSIGIFLIAQLVPGDAAITLAGEGASPQRIAEVRHELHLDESLFQQYGRWLAGAVHLDFGHSLSSGASVGHDLSSRFPVTLGLVLGAAIAAIVVGVPLGILSGLRSGGIIDQTSRMIASASISIPSFWLAPLLVILFGVKTGWFPVSGYVAFTDSPAEWLRHVALPAVSLGLFLSAWLARQLRSALIDVLRSNYVRTLLAKGAGPRTVAKHALRNAASSTVTVFGVQLGVLIGGTVIIEQIFAIPGLGSYLLRAVAARDIPAIQGVAIVLAACQVAISLLIDISYALLNPKVRIA